MNPGGSWEHEWVCAFVYANALNLEKESGGQKHSGPKVFHIRDIQSYS